MVGICTEECAGNGVNAMENPIAISLLNDFVFCPASIYFHMVDEKTDKLTYGSHEQLQGSALHIHLDQHNYSTKKSVLQGIDVYCEEHGLAGKIDLFDCDTGMLTERKRKISAVYDGQIFQLFAYCLALREMGYDVREMRIHSMMDNRNYPIPLPEEDKRLFDKFIETIQQMRSLDLQSFHQDNGKKCTKCVYEPLCSYSGKEEYVDSS